jgi:hypothetical protein
VLRSDTIFDMPLTVAAPRDQPGVLELHKDNVPRGGLSAPVLVPCEQQQIVFNSLRTFKLDPQSRVLTVHNASTVHNTTSDALCLTLGRPSPAPDTLHVRSNSGGGSSRGGGSSSGRAPREASAGRQVLTVRCNGSSSSSAATAWVLSPPSSSDDGRSGSGGGQLRTEDGWCLSAIRDPRLAANVTQCPGGSTQSYYTNPSVHGACQSAPWSVLATRCAAAGSAAARRHQSWSWDASSGFLRFVMAAAAPQGGGGVGARCLAAVPPRIVNSAALRVQVRACRPPWAARCLRTRLLAPAEPYDLFRADTRTGRPGCA